MENIMVAFSSTEIPENLIERSVNLAKKRGARLIVLDVRNKKMGEKVAELTENVGFMGDKVVGVLAKEITQSRCGVIYRRISSLETLANEKDVPYEIIVAKGPFGKSVLQTADRKNVKDIILHRKEKLDQDECEGYQITYV